MAVQTEAIHKNEGNLSEGNRTISREEITVVSGQNLGSMFVVGKITATGKYKEYDNALADGSQTAAGVLIGAVDATSGDKKGAILARYAEVDYDLLQWKAAMSQGDKDAGVADLAALGIIVRGK
jgi:hypothetical protein